MRIVYLLAQLSFWVSGALILYAYFLYPILLLFCYAFVQLRSDLGYLLGRRERRVPALRGEELPSVTFLIPAYNEEKHLRQKIANLFEMDYPREKLQIIFISDGSTDATNEILASLCDSGIELLALSERAGKANALNQGVLRARHDLLIFSDASTLFASDAVRSLVRHFSDETVGVVCGALRFQAGAESQQTEGVYWRYESMMRLMEARLGATLTASGAVYALRRNAYVPLTPGAVLDDFLIPMNARRHCYRVLYDPEAVATDFAAENVQGEFTRRVRLAVGSFQSFGHLLRTPMDGFTRFAFLSHKVLRWILPLLLCMALISNLILIRYSWFYTVLGILQLAFYFWAWIGYLLQKRITRVRYALLGYFILAMNLAFLVGFFRYLTNRGEATWQRVN